VAKDTFYFPHDFNATNDPKLVRLISSCGMEGLGMYWALIEILHQQSDGKISLDEYAGYIRFYVPDETRALKIEQVLNKCSLLVEQDGFISCNRVLENKRVRESISKSRSLAGKRSGEVRLQTIENKEERTLVPIKRTFVEQNRTKERKGKEIKEKKIGGGEAHALPISFEFLKEQVQNHCLQKKFFGINAEDMAVKLSYVIKANGFAKANGSEVKDWSSQIYLLMEKELKFKK
jgi:hypothetical protein